MWVPQSPPPFKITAKRCQIVQMYVLGRIRKYCNEIIYIEHAWAFDWCESQPVNTLITPKIGDIKTPPLSSGQAVADGATLLTDWHCEVIVVANAPKHSVDSH